MEASNLRLGSKARVGTFIIQQLGPRHARVTAKAYLSAQIDGTGKPVSTGG